MKEEAARHRRLPGIASYLVPGLGQVVWLSTFVAALLAGPRMLNVDGDLGRHITIGNHILNSRSIPTHDIFSHTMAGAELTPHEWLAQVAFAASHRALGLQGPVLLTALLIALTFWIVFRTSRSTSRAPVLSLLAVGLAICASALHWLTRPHVFTFALFALWLHTLHRMRHDPARAWWRLPLLMVAWANVHGAFIAGFVTLGIWASALAAQRVWAEPDARLPDRFWRLTGAAAVLCVAASLVNPAGPHLWATSVGYLGNSFLVDNTAEYRSPDFHDPGSWPFALMIGLLIVLLGVRERPRAAEHVVVGAAWLLLALYSMRNIPLFAIAAAPLLARLAHDGIESLAPRARALRAWAALEARLAGVDAGARGGLWPAVVLGLALASAALRVTPAYGGERSAFDARVFPVRAVNWLESQRVEGPGFNYFTWGGYLLYRTWPARRVFIDGQTDFYGEALTREYTIVLGAHAGWEDVLRKYSVQWVLVPRYAPIARALAAHALWQLVYEDDTAAVYQLRNREQNAQSRTATGA